jgi:hypothetical protein
VISLLYKDQENQTLALNEFSHYTTSGGNAVLLSLTTSESKATIGNPFAVQSLLNGIDSDQILSSTRKINQENIPGEEGNLVYTIPQAGTYIIQQVLTLINGNILQATITVQANDSIHNTTIGYSFVPSTFTTSQT